MAAQNGVFSARDNRGDGLDLRRLSYAGEVLSSRLYFAVRDRWWRTVPLTIVRRRRTTTPDGFELAIDAVTAWESHPMDVSLRYVGAGTELVADVTATARATFAYCRIGFCLLFPADAYRGLHATSWRSGVPTAFTFPEEIVTRAQTDPVSTRFHRPFDGIETVLASGSRLRYAFDGELFEFEDQRNWTDASYKAYSVPPPGGWPADAVDGQRFSQRVRLHVVAAGTGAAGGAPRTVRLGGPVGAVPPIGLFHGRVSPRSLRPPGGFQELNSRRADARATECDSLELAVNGAVHAADDDSVQETTALHGDIVRQARAIRPGVPVRLAPVSFLDIAGDWRNDAGHYWPEPPVAAAPARQLGEFAATWAIASAARAVPAGPDLLHYFDATLPADTPAARAVARLGALAGHEALAVQAPAPLAALAVVTGDTVVVAVANPAPDAVRFRLPDGRAVALDGFASAWFTLFRDAVPASAPGVIHRESETPD